MKTLIILFVSLLMAGAAGAVEPHEMLKDPALEARAREVSKSLRCVVCQNETIDESSADIARDMRLLVRVRILAGDTNEQVHAFLVSRYGDYILLMPRFRAGTAVLWLGPLAILVFGAWVVARRLRARTVHTPDSLTPQEEETLRALARDGDRTP